MNFDLISNLILLPEHRGGEQGEDLHGVVGEQQVPQVEQLVRLKVFNESYSLVLKREFNSSTLVSRDSHREASRESSHDPAEDESEWLDLVADEVCPQVRLMQLNLQNLFKFLIKVLIS